MRGAARAPFTHEQLQTGKPALHYLGNKIKALKSPIKTLRPSNYMEIEKNDISELWFKNLVIKSCGNNVGLLHKYMRDLYLAGLIRCYNGGWIGRGRINGKPLDTYQYAYLRTLIADLFPELTGTQLQILFHDKNINKNTIPAGKRLKTIKDKQAIDAIFTASRNKHKSRSR